MGNPTLQPSVSKPTSYDEVLYPGFSFVQSHPDRLATQATMFGMTPAALESCRILELGCGDGANIIPVAFGLPHSRCLGIDLAARPIAIGQGVIDALGLKNIALRQMDMMDAGKDLGEFDYIIAHGIYSWTPPAVQDKLLAICSENLAPDGVAYVSYNAYPGGHIRQMMRRMMLYHTRNISDPMERVRNGLGFLQGLIASLKEPDPI
ncbi:MAG: methyltransferase domain-containing protein, partial [Terriglobia bacterium]